MSIHTDRATYLLNVWVNQESTSDEEEELFDWLHQEDRSMVLTAYISDLESKLREDSVEAISLDVDWGVLFNKIMQRREEPGMPESLQMMDASSSGQIIPINASVVKGNKWRKWGWVAAAVILLAGVGILRMFQNDSVQSIVNVEHTSQSSIPPGKEGAILTLADGTQVVLDSANDGVIATQNGAEVSLHNNQLTYSPNTSANASGAAFNTVQTPKGRHYRVQLPDGSIAWLNAASSIKYPTAFNGKNRNVEITGEVYLEVAPNSIAPFTVHVENKMDVVVLGTSFNIQAYANETTIQTTLIEGSVKVNGTMLKPGEQALLPNTDVADESKVKVVNNAELGGVLAWKNGLFDFRGKGIEELMRQLERWYDIEVVYPNGVPGNRFDGKISRDLTLEEVLDGLKRAGVRSKLDEGRRLIIF